MVSWQTQFCVRYLSNPDTCRILLQGRSFVKRGEPDARAQLTDS
jgi:hypothetical protein